MILSKDWKRNALNSKLQGLLLSAYTDHGVDGAALLDADALLDVRCVISSSLAHRPRV